MTDFIMLIQRPMEVRPTPYGTQRADISSPLLDEHLHRDGTLRAGFDSEIVSRGEDMCIRLDSFQLNSLNEYLTHQSELRKSAEGVLIADYTRRQLPPLQASERSIWEVATISCVTFPARNVLTTEDIERLSKILPSTNADEIAQMGDTADTKSRFILEVDASWDRNHGPKLLHYRDRQFLEMSYITS